jgi:hypothetical protein
MIFDKHNLIDTWNRNCISCQYILLVQCYDKINIAQINRTECAYYAVFVPLLVRINLRSDHFHQINRCSV